VTGSRKFSRTQHISKKISVRCNTGVASWIKVVANSHATSMQSLTYCPDTSNISLGERRGNSDLARFSLDLSWARAVSDIARSRAYPSPPMSGSPPLPPRRNPDVSDRGHGGYGSMGQDVFRGIQTSQSEYPERSRGPPLRAAYAEPQPLSTPYTSYRLEDMQPQGQYQQPPRQQIQLPPHPPPTYVQQPPQPFPPHDRSSTAGGPEFSSPKAQRKTKGHVASACVPCKRAHLRYVISHPVLHLPDHDLTQYRCDGMFVSALSYTIFAFPHSSRCLFLAIRHLQPSFFSFTFIGEGWYLFSCDQQRDLIGVKRKSVITAMLNLLIGCCAAQVILHTPLKRATNSPESSFVVI
jgi:hypothetical protein